MKTILNNVYIADAYFRLSREDGDKAESDSIVNQKALVREFLKIHPEIQIYKEKVDDGYTGVSFERPAFQEMLEDIKAGKVNCVIVKDLSRFGRNYIEAGRYIEKIFPYLGVRFIAINDDIDTASAMNNAEKMLIPFKNLINDAYCRDISIKIRSHLDIKRKNGQFIGSFAPFGYRKDPENKNRLVIDEEAAVVVRRIFKWKLEGMSSSGIADKLNELGFPTPMEYKRKNGENFQCGFRRKPVLRWQTNGVNYILKNELYTGVLQQGKTFSPNYKVQKRSKKDKRDWICCEGTHEAIISKEEFDIVQDLFNNDTRIGPEQKTLYWFSGVVKCGYCKGNMTRKTVPQKGKNYVYLVCAENKKKSGCSNHKSISLNRFEKVILDVINLQIEKVFELKRMLGLADKIGVKGRFEEKLCSSIAEKEMEINKMRRYSVDSYKDYKEGMLTKEEYLELKDSFYEDINALIDEIKALKREQEKMLQMGRGKAEWMQNFIRCRGFPELTREFLLKLVDEIRVYDKDRIEVIFQFQEMFEPWMDYGQPQVRIGGTYNGENQQETK